MAKNAALIDKVRAALAHLPDVVEKKMFGGVTFMVNGKMCIGVGKDRLMCRIDRAIHEKALKRKGCTTVVMNGREYRGFIHVTKKGSEQKETLISGSHLHLTTTRTRGHPREQRRSKLPSGSAQLFNQE